MHMLEVSSANHAMLSDCLFHAVAAVASAEAGERGNEQQPPRLRLALG
jgi:hypothetical protein